MDQRLPPIRVIKLGGSLLERPGYAAALQAWLARQSPARSLVLVGGGPPVDAIRQLASVNSYPDELLHWLCIDLMNVSVSLVASQLPAWDQLVSASQLQEWTACGQGLALVHVGAFYDRHCPLPIGWATTSDSLAALLAALVSAQELVLIKSCEPAPLAQLSWQQLADRGIVDQAFPQAVLQVKHARICSLSEPTIF